MAITWNLSGVDYWVIGAVSLKPAVRPFQPDAMVKLSTEANIAYFYDYWYENPVSLQLKSTSVLATVSAIRKYSRKSSSPRPRELLKQTGYPMNLLAK